MPELPEVETLCRQLQEKICGRKILASEVYDEKLAGIKNLKGRKYQAVERRGKTITILLDDGNFVLIHLRMTGRLLWQKDSTRPKHSRWRMTFKDGNVFLVDPRRFATVKVEKTRPERNPPTICSLVLTKRLFWRNRPDARLMLKSLLMDPKAMAGIGNIYACEILHRSGISPLTASFNFIDEGMEEGICQCQTHFKKGY